MKDQALTTRTNKLIVGAIVALFAVAAVDALRTSEPQNSTSVSSSAAEAARRARTEYLRRAGEICVSANNHMRALEVQLEIQFADDQWIAEALGSAERALTKLRALRRPAADQARIAQILSLMEQETDALREFWLARLEGDAARTKSASTRRLRATNRKSGFVIQLVRSWGLSGGTLRLRFLGCPVELPS